MSVPLFDFRTTEESFGKVLRSLRHDNAVNDDDSAVLSQLQTIQDEINKIPGSDVEKRTALDGAFRKVLVESVESLAPQEEFLGIVTIAAKAIKSEFVSASTLFVMLQDIFDCLTLDRCEQVFTFLEDRVAMWKEDIYYNAGKNYLLRMCNDLLRRLSRSKNTVFCGRIQLFLAKLFPLSEKSGLNIMSQFNLENVTTFNTKPEEYDPIRKASVDEKDESMEYEEGETADNTSNIPIDYNLYRKFWSLQDYFRKPTQCYDKAAWSTFTTNSDDVLSCFESFKLEDTRSHKKKCRDEKTKSRSERSSGRTSPELPDSIGGFAADEDVYFAKYLTSEKLLDLQLSDSNFRRYLLVQMLIMFQYLSAQVRFKSSTQVLSDEQTAWIKKMTERIYKALRETYPYGDAFAQTTEHILSREENWNTWKNDNCPSFVRGAAAEKEGTKVAASGKKRSIGDDLKSSGGKLIKMGNSELTRLWNLCPDNMSACRTEQRNFLPLMEDFFEEAIEQMDPEAMIEDEYKLVKNPTFAWKSLRLLSRRSPNFFSQAPNTAQKKKSVPEYLEAMLAKIAKEMPVSQMEDIKTEVDDGVDQESAGSADDQLGGGGSDQLSSKQDEVALRDQLPAFAARLTDDWQKLAAELGFMDDQVTYFEGENDDKEAQAQKMLLSWLDNEDEPGTVSVLRCALKEVGLESLANDILGEPEDT